MSRPAGNHYSFREDVREFRHLSLKGKGYFLWDYYRLWIIAIICFISVAVFLAIRITSALDGYWCYVGFVNTRADIGDGSQFCEDFIDYAGYDTSEKNVEFNNTLYFDYTQNQAKGNTYYEMFVAYIDSGVLDVAVMETDALQSFGESGRLMDLNSDAVAGLAEKYSDRLIYCTPNDEEYSEEPVAVGIDLSGSILDTQYDLYDGSFAMGISAMTERPEAAEQFLDFIFTEAG